MRVFIVGLFLAALCLGQPLQARAIEGMEVNLLSSFNQDTIYWRSDLDAPAFDAADDTTCSGQPLTAGAALQSTPPPADAAVHPFGGMPSLRKAYIAVVIDDVGLDQRRSARAMDLPAGVTLAFLPYAGNIQAQTAQAAAKGHELMVHLPMEPSRMTADPGPDYLGVSHTAEELEKRINRNLDAFSGYKGVNNHMGSAFTQHADGLAVLMRALKKRGVYFLDSKTAQGSIAEDMARAKGIPATHRDVFIDHFEDAARVWAALEKTERIARASGYAVAIGHPKDVTLDALERWLPTLAEKNIELIPMGELIKKRHAAAKPYSAAAAGLNE